MGVLNVNWTGPMASSVVWSHSWVGAMTEGPLGNAGEIETVHDPAVDTPTSSSHDWKAAPVGLAGGWSMVAVTEYPPPEWLPSQVATPGKAGDQPAGGD